MSHIVLQKKGIGTACAWLSILGLPISLLFSLVLGGMAQHIFPDMIYGPHGLCPETIYETSGVIGTRFVIYIFRVTMWMAVLLGCIASFGFKRYLLGFAGISIALFCLWVSSLDFHSLA